MPIGFTLLLNQMRSLSFNAFFFFKETVSPYKVQVGLELVIFAQCAHYRQVSQVARFPSELLFDVLSYHTSFF